MTDRLLTDEPRPGEVRKSYEIGKSNRKSWQYFIWLICENCGNGRWVATYKIKADTFTNICLKCIYLFNEFPNFVGANREDHYHWQGGVMVCHGYRRILLEPNSEYTPMADAKGRVAEHRLIMARYLGRLLTDDEIIHHINGIVTDNRIENLQIMTNGEHISFHNNMRYQK